MIIIGSSLRGLFDPTEDDKDKKMFADLLRAKINDGVPVRFLLTHPALAFLREDAEGRAYGSIKEEIIGTVKYLVGGQYVDDGHPSVGVPMKDIRLYHGTPTIFSVIVSDRMLLNPYTYQANAFDNFCFEVTRKTGNDLYSQVLRAHYQAPWDKSKTRTILTDSVMVELDTLTLEDVFPTWSTGPLKQPSGSARPSSQRRSHGRR